MDQEDTKGLLEQFYNLLSFLLPRFDREGKSYLVVAVGCTGGKHRSVVTSNEVSGMIEKLGYSVSLTHRDIDRE